MVEFINCKIGNHPEYDKGWKDCQNHQQQKIDELQKRIDDATDFLNSSNANDEYYVLQAIKILKGAANET